jgi:hypothetical protein
MRDLSRLSEAELDAALAELGARTLLPPAPDVADRVMERLRVAELPQPRSRRPGRSLLAAAAAIAALAVALSLVALPDLRRAVADWLGVPGIGISTEPHATTPPPTTAGLQLGPRVTLEEARAQVDFEVAFPRALGRPDSAHLESPPPGGRVSLVYRPRPGLPPAKSTGVGLLLTQFPGTVTREFVHKVATPGVRVRSVRAGDLPAYWLSGSPHTILYLDGSGRIREDAVRFADNVLLWQDDGVVFRLESALNLERALALARSTR